MEIKIYKTLPREAMLIRDEVFVREQGFKDEYDDIDKIAVHFVAYDGDTPVATCRIFESENPGIFILGRLAVIKKFRGGGIGSRIISEAEKYVVRIGGKSIILHSQLHAKDFYKKAGYIEYGEVELEQDSPHIWMKKKPV